jgi:prephenate dehydrogenase
MGNTPIQIVNSIPQVAIVGVGLLGGSIGLGLKQAGYTGRILGVGRRQASLDKARDHGCIDETALPSDTLWQVDRPTLVILATPICTFEEHLKAIGQAGGRNLIITDAGSTKAVVCDYARKHLPDPSWFVGAHPMAGSEKQGPEHADAAMLRNRPTILTPLTDTQPDAIRIVAALWQAIGMRTMEMTPEDHDNAVAAISHLPHALAMQLVINAQRQPRALDIAAGGFRDTTRVASGDVAIWKDIFLTNRQAMITMIDQFTADLTHLRDRIAAGDEAFVAQQLGLAKTVRDQWAASPDRGGSLSSQPAE